MWNSLRTRLTITFIVLAVGPLLLVGAIMAQRSFAAEREQALDLQNQVAQRVSAEVSGLFQNVENDLSTLAGELRGLEQPDRAQQLGILLSAFNTGAYRDAYEEFGWLDANGQEQIRVSRQEIFSSDQLSNRSDEDVYLRPIEDGHTYFSSVRFDETSSRAFVTIAIPVFEPRSVQLSGVLITDLRFTVVSDLLTRIRVGEDQTAYIADAEDRVVAHQELALASADSQIDVPEEANFQTGLTHEAAVLGVDPIELGGQTLYAVAEVAQSEALALANSLVTTLIVVSAVSLAVAVGVGFTVVRGVVRPMEQLATTAVRITQGDFTQEAEVIRRDEIGTLATAFNNMTAQLRNLIGTLEQRVAQRTQVIETSAEVSRRLSTILDSAELTTTVVELLQFAFKYYHAHIYLYDEAREYLVMAGGTGEAGQAMLANNHKIESGKGVVGRTAENNKPTLVPDVTADPDWLPNPLLPETKAEVAVPITLEDEVVGVLDIQHNIAGGLDQTDVVLLASVANQVAIGLQNARLFAQVELEKRQLQTILESLSLPVVISRVSNGLVAYVNHALTETFRLSREELIGRITPNFYANLDDRERVLTALREQGVVKDLETVFKRGDGEHFWGLTSGSIINYEGEPAIIASVLDIDARKDAENLLVKQANELSTVAKVSTAAATILDPQELLQQVADLTKSNFDLYHAHIHLLDDSGQTLVLTAGAGEVGRKMVAEGRRIPLSATGSLVASVARNVAGAIRTYESPEEGFMPHPLLTATRSEMAVPIAIGKQVLGVLDVRSDQFNYFDESDLQTVTTLASQVAVALQNARSYTRSEKALQELQELSRRLTREGWDEFFEQQLEELTYRYDLEQVGPVVDSDEESESETEAMLAQPLQVQGEPIGELLLDSTKRNDEEAAEIVAAVADRLSAHLENLRLAQQTQNALNETQRRTEELAVLNEMSQALTAQTTVDGVFQTVYSYLSRLMDTTDFYTVIYDEENDEVEFILTASGEKLRWHTERRQAGHGITEYLIRRRQPLLIPNNVGQQLAALGIEGHGNLPESWLGVPIMLGDRVLGVIGVESYTTPNLYHEQHLNLLTAVANQTAIAIESTRLLEGTVALAEEEQILRQITTRVGTAIDAESILRTAAEEIGRALGLEGYVSLEGVDGNGTNGHEPVANSLD